MLLLLLRPGEYRSAHPPRVMYRKLNVSSRNAAVERSRELGLL